MNLANKILSVILLLLISANAYGFRMAKPFTLTYPLDEKQVSELNGMLNDLWNIQNGRQNLDTPSTTRTNADNGDIWIHDDGTPTLQFRAGGTTYTITPDP